MCLYGCLYGFGGFARAGRIADRAADDDVVGTVRKRRLYRHHAFLVARGLVVDGADAGRHDQQLVVNEFPQPRHLEAGRDDAVAAGFQCALCPRQDQFADVAIEAEIVEEDEES